MDLSGIILAGMPGALAIVIPMFIVVLAIVLIFSFAIDMVRDFFNSSIGKAVLIGALLIFIIKFW